MLFRADRQINTSKKIDFGHILVMLIMSRNDDTFGGQDYGDFTFQDIATVGDHG